MRLGDLLLIIAAALVVYGLTLIYDPLGYVAAGMVTAATWFYFVDDDQ